MIIYCAADRNYFDLYFDLWEKQTSKIYPELKRHIALHNPTDEQKQKYLPKFSTGEIIGSFALTEPDSGSDAMSITTSAKKVGNEYLINGTKRYITNAPIAGVFSVMARTNEEKKQWKDENSTNQWKEENLKIIVTRMQGWQLNTFRESYEHKKNKGISLFKKNLLESKN